MAALPPHAEFISAAHDLSHAAPEHWKAFVAAFDSYAKYSCVSAVQAPNDSASVARGHAQGYLLLANLLMEIEARYRSLQDKKR